MAHSIILVTRLVVSMTIVHRDPSPPMPQVSAVLKRAIDTETNSTGFAAFKDRPGWPQPKRLRSKSLNWCSRVSAVVDNRFSPPEYKDYRGQSRLAKGT
jgi:hypothetical protein